MPPPQLGKFELVAGNGTSVGTVMTLICPLNHRAISGGRITCVQESNITEWSGGIPACRLVTHIEGFRLALFLSIVSTAIIMLMSIFFITSWLLERLKKEELRRLERERKEETERLWHHLDAEEQREYLYAHDSNINNNNNNNNNSNRQAQHPRCHKKNYPDPLPIHHSQSTVRQMPPLPPCV
ncbi:sushi domain-containing protein 3 isoform X2 [Tachysurus fulvidraco]|nr:sushi domain-containing protein 3 isoform X2 [Tachysurus fulvidraco]